MTVNNQPVHFPPEDSSGKMSRKLFCFTWMGKKTTLSYRNSITFRNANTSSMELNV